MEIKIEAKSKRYLYWILCALTLAAVLPGIFQRDEAMEVALRIVLFMIQVGTLLTSVLCFQRIFEEAETRLPAYFGVLLYMTCPYRIYVCYELADVERAAAWLLLPLYVLALMGIVRKRSLANIAFAGTVVAAIGYEDTMLFVFVLGLTLIAAVVLRKPWFLLSAAFGLMLGLPIIYGLIGFLFQGIFNELGISAKSIMGSGYRFGEYFQSFAYREGHPGMGLGMLICLLTGVWLAFVKGVKEEHKICRFFGVTAVVLTVLSFYLFPWDVIQRLGEWALIFVTLIDTPAFFWGLALACLCVPAACAMDRISKAENKLIAVGVPVTVILACLGVCIYQCGRFQ